MYKKRNYQFYNDFTRNVFAVVSMFEAAVTSFCPHFKMKLK
jgi:hypothetical protein